MIDRLLQTEDNVVTNVAFEDGTLSLKRYDGSQVDVRVPGSTAPIVVRRADAGGLILLPATAGWQDIDPDGSPTARPLDVVIPNVEVDQWIDVSAAINSGATSGLVYLDMFTIVDGEVVNRFGPGELEDQHTSWILEANLPASDVGNARTYQLKEEDIQDGSVRLRLRSYHFSGDQRVILYGYGFEFNLVGRGPFG